MTRAFVKGCLAGLLVLGCGPDTRVPEPTVEVRAADGLQTLPWIPGGKFTIKVDVPRPETGRICGPLNARAEITTPTLTAGAVTVSNFSLSQEGDCGAHQGLTELAWPEGGAFQLRLSVAGKAQVLDFQMDEPKVRIVRGAQRREGAQLAVPLCIVSSAARGAVTLTAEGGTLDNGQSSRRLELGSTPCDDQLVLASPRTRWASAVLLTTSEQATIRADLEGRATDALAVKLLPELRLLDLSVSPGPPTLPAPGQVFAVTILATVNGAAADGVPIRIETTPQAQVLPSTGLSNEQGLFTVYITVPEGARSMRIDAISGSLRRGQLVNATP